MMHRRSTAATKEAVAVLVVSKGFMWTHTKQYFELEGFFGAGTDQGELQDMMQK
jgi:hypothetical protein